MQITYTVYSNKKICWLFEFTFTVHCWCILCNVEIASIVNMNKNILTSYRHEKETKLYALYKLETNIGTQTVLTDLTFYHLTL